MPTDNQAIEAMIKARYPEADAFTFQESLSLPEATILYVEFAGGDYEDERDAYYVLTSPAGVILFEDAIDALAKVQNLIERRRSFWQRLTGGNVNDLVASIIALAVTAGFFVHLALKNGVPNESLLAVFTLVLGYYFGKKS